MADATASPASRCRFRPYANIRSWGIASWGGAAVVAALTLTASSWLSGPPTVRAQNLAGFRHIHSDIVVHPDGSMTVTETIGVRASVLSREFQTVHRGAWGSRVVVEFTVVEALRDEQPVAYQLESERDSTRLVTRGPAPVATYTLVYRINRQLESFPDHDDLYWNVMGSALDDAADEASVRVVLPDTVPAGSVSLDGRTGPRGRPGKDFQAAIDDSAAAAFSFSTQRPLVKGEGFEILVAWPKGLIAGPSLWDGVRYSALDNSVALTGLVGCWLVVAYYRRVWRRVAREAAGGRRAVLFEPPQDLSPAGVRLISKGRADERGFAAALVNMAVKGFLTIGWENDHVTLRQRPGDRRQLTPQEEALATELGSDDPERARRLLASANPGLAIAAVLDNRVAPEEYAIEKLLASDEPPQNPLPLREALDDFSKSMRVHSAVAARASGAALIGKRAPEWWVLIVLTVMATLPLGQPGWIAVVWGWIAFGLGAILVLPSTTNEWSGTSTSRGWIGKRRIDSNWVFRPPWPVRVIVALPGLALLGFALFLFSTVNSVLAVSFLVLPAMYWGAFKVLSARAEGAASDEIEGFKRYLAGDAPRAAANEAPKALRLPARTPALFEELLPYAIALEVEREWAEQFADVLVASGPDRAPYLPSWCSGIWDSTDPAGSSRSLGVSLSEAIASS